jgi:hypothetical protein
MCFELDESPILVEFSLLLEVRFEWHIIRRHLLKTSGVRFQGDIIWRHFVKTGVVLLFTVIHVCIINDLFGLCLCDGFCCGRIILLLLALLVLASPCFLAE